MRNSTRLILGAAILLAAPVAAQEATNGVTATTANDAVTAPDAGLATTNDLDANADLATAPVNGLTAGPGTAPATTEPDAVDLSYGDPAPADDDDRFPWGLLGLLGLAGLIPRKPRNRVDSDRR